MSANWSIYAVKYAERNTRTRADSFLDDDHPALPHGMDYYVWVLDNGEDRIVVDTGYDAKEGERRGRPIEIEPSRALSALGFEANDVDRIIVSHLHYDHAGGLDRYPNAHFHLQEAEMNFATGKCMCDPEQRAPFTADHVCEMVKKVYSGRVEFHDGDAEIAKGVTVHKVGGHSMGLQAVRVETNNGPFCLASDASHYFENFEKKKVFPIVHDPNAVLAGYELIQKLAGDPSRIIPGHDPLVRERFPAFGTSGFVWKMV